MIPQTLSLSALCALLLSPAIYAPVPVAPSASSSFSVASKTQYMVRSTLIRNPTGMMVAFAFSPIKICKEKVFQQEAIRPLFGENRGPVKVTFEDVVVTPSTLSLDICRTTGVADRNFYEGSVSAVKKGLQMPIVSYNRYYFIAIRNPGAANCTGQVVAGHLLFSKQQSISVGEWIADCPGL